MTPLTETGNVRHFFKIFFFRNSHSKTKTGTQHGKQNALLPLLRVTSTKSTDLISVNVMHENQNRLISVKDVVPSMIGLLREKSNNNIFHDVISSTRTCSDAGISSRFCLCSKWIKSSHPPFAMLETLIARMNRQIRDSLFARRQCEILHLSRVIDTRLLSRSSFLSHHGPHLTSQRYRFRFLVYVVFERENSPLKQCFREYQSNVAENINRASFSLSLGYATDRHDNRKSLKNQRSNTGTERVPLWICTKRMW